MWFRWEAGRAGKSLLGALGPECAWLSLASKLVVSSAGLGHLVPVGITRLFAAKLLPAVSIE